MFKGVSPLIASVILVGLVIATAVIYNTWVIGYVGGETTFIGGKGAEHVTCMQAFVKAEGAQYNSTSKKFSVVLNHEGTVSLGNFKVIVIYANGTTLNLLASPNATALAPGGAAGIWASPIENVTFSKVRITHNCSEANPAAVVDILDKDIKKVT